MHGPIKPRAGKPSKISVVVESFQFLSHPLAAEGKLNKTDEPDKMTQEQAVLALGEAEISFSRLICR